MSFQGSSTSFPQDKNCTGTQPNALQVIKGEDMFIGDFIYYEGGAKTWGEDVKKHM